MTKGIQYILLATFFFTLMNIGVKYLDHIPAYEIVFFRALVSLIVCYIMLKQQKIYPWGNDKKNLLLRGIFGTLGLTMYFYTIQQMPLVSAVTIQYLSPIFTIIIAGIMLKEPPRLIQWFFFLMSFSGVVMIKGFDPRIDPIDLIFGISAAICSGFAYNYIRKLKKTDHPLVVVLYFPLVTVPIVGAYTMFHWVSPHLLEWIILLAVGGATTIAQIYMTKAYQMERASNVSNFNYLGSVYALIIGYFLFGESISPLGLCGIAVIIIGVLLSARYKTIPT